MTSLIYWQ